MPVARFTVAIPCYRAARYIEATLDSVAAQTVVDWELVVVDDGSPDDSAERVAARAALDPRIKLVRQANAGVCRARNAAFAASTPGTDYVLFLDADDCLEPAALERMAAYLDARPDVGMVHCSQTYIDDAGAPHPEDSPLYFMDMPRLEQAGRLGLRAAPADDPVTTFAQIFCLAGIVPSLCLLRRSVYEATDGWDEEFGQHHEDTDLFLQMAIQAPVHFLPERLVRYRRHGSQNTADMARFGRQEHNLVVKWRHHPGLTIEQSELVAEAIQMREGLMQGAKGIATARRELTAGHLAAALRFGGGALRRYGLHLLRPRRLVRRITD